MYVVMDVNYTYGSEHLAIDTNIKPLCYYTSETNISQVNYIPIF